MLVFLLLTSLSKLQVFTSPPQLQEELEAVQISLFMLKKKGQACISQCERSYLICILSYKNFSLWYIKAAFNIFTLHGSRYVLYPCFTYGKGKTDRLEARYSKFQMTNSQKAELRCLLKLALFRFIIIIIIIMMIMTGHLLEQQVKLY